MGFNGAKIQHIDFIGDGFALLFNGIGDMNIVRRGIGHCFWDDYK